MTLVFCGHCGEQIEGEIISTTQGGVPSAYCSSCDSTGPVLQLGPVLVRYLVMETSEVIRAARDVGLLEPMDSAVFWELPEGEQNLRERLSSLESELSKWSETVWAR